MSDLVTGSTALSIELSAARARIEALEAALTKLKDKINYRLNNYLCDMKPNYDDSITGFLKFSLINRNPLPNPHDPRAAPHQTLTPASSGASSR